MQLLTEKKTKGDESISTSLPSTHAGAIRTQLALRFRSVYGGLDMNHGDPTR